MVLRCLAAAALLVLTSCRSTESKKSNGGGASLRPLNVVLVTVDTLRSDRLGCYGYSKIETPNLDGLARRGVLFENAAAQAPLTAPSHASMMTGVNPNVHKVRDTGGFVLAPSETTLARTLQQQGWDTAAFIGASVLKRRFGFSHGFNVYDDEMPAGGTPAAGEGGPSAERRAAVVVDRAIEWLAAQSGKPFFLWVHVYDPHLPYDPPAGFREKYKGSPYDGEIAYTDRELGRLFDAVAKKAPQNTVIAALSDHGEAFAENGEYAHGVFLYDTTVRIPFLLAGPGVPAGVRVKQQARTIDLLPTLLELLGGKAAAHVQGTSLVPAFTGKPAPTGDSYTETLFPKLNMGWAELRGVRTNRWKYIRAPKPELYDLSHDPGETKNVIAQYPAEAQTLEARLKEMAGSGSETVQPAAVDRRTLDQLKSLGYLGGSSQREYTLTGTGVDPKDRTGVLKLLHFGVNSELPTTRRVAMLQDAIRQDPSNPTLYSNLGDILRDAGRHGDEMTLYKRAVDSGMRSAWLFSRLGHLYLKQGNKADSIPFFEAAAQLNPHDYESLQNLAVAYRETGRVDDAEGILKAILKSGEEFAAAYNELGMVAYQKGDRAAARAHFEKAARIDTAYQLNLARLLKMQGETAGARAAFEAFLAAKGNSPEYRQMIPQVRRELATLE